MSLVVFSSFLLYWLFSNIQYVNEIEDANYQCILSTNPYLIEEICPVFVTKKADACIIDQSIDRENKFPFYIEFKICFGQIIYNRRFLRNDLKINVPEKLVPSFWTFLT
jgi:hypothetical protein